MFYISTIKKNFIYNTLYQLLAIALPLITTPYISRVLGPDKIGQFSYSYSIAYYFVMFAMLGLNNYGNRTIAMVRDDKMKLSKTFLSIYYMQLITSFIMIFLYVMYGLVYSNTLMTWILLLYVVSSALDINWFFFGMEQFKLTVIRNTIVKVFTTISILIFVKNKEDIYLYAVIMILGILISQALLWTFVKKYIHFYKVSVGSVIQHIKPNLILFMPVIAVSLYKIMDKIMLGMFSNMTEVGFYESSEKIIAIPLALVGSLGTVMLPKVSNLMANNKNNQANKYFSFSIVFAMFLSTSMCFGIMGVADVFVPIFYGAGYERCITLFQILLPSCVFLAFDNVLITQYLIPNKKDSIYIKSVALGAIVNVIINLILIPKYASIGAAIGTLVAEGTVCLYQSYKVRKEVDTIKYYFKTVQFILTGFCMYLILLFFPDVSTSQLIQLCTEIIVGCTFYLCTIIIINYKKILTLKNKTQ